MTTSTMLQDIERYIPVIGDANIKSPLAYKATRQVVEVVNAAQMAAAEAYINGLEIPDSLLQPLLETFASMLFRYSPSLLFP
jgi:cyclopropane-fatty-acyl-phospholipid synthase